MAKKQPKEETGPEVFIEDLGLDPQHLCAKTHGGIAKFMGVAVQTVHQWSAGARAGRGSPMPGVRGKYPLGDIAKWRIEIAEKRWKRGANHEVDDELKVIARDRARLELDTERGLYVSVEDVRRDVRQWVSTFRSRLSAIPDIVAGMVDGPEKAAIKARVESAIWAALEECSTAVVGTVEVSE